MPPGACAPGAGVMGAVTSVASAARSARSEPRHDVQGGDGQLGGIGS